MENKTKLKCKITIMYIVFIVLLILLMWQSVDGFSKGIALGSNSPEIELYRQNHPFLSVLGSIVSILMLICYVVMFVYIFMILNSLRKSIVNGTVFNKKNINRIRVIGIMAICIPIFMCVILASSQYMQIKIFAGSESAQISILQFIDIEKIVFGVVILFFAEVFSIGYKLSEEQKLTI